MTSEELLKRYANGERDFACADLSGADLYGADLNGANLNGADLNGANLNGADLSDANLSGATLNGANLSDANLSYADLYGADLRGANLCGADLSGADLRGANLCGATLSGADLCGANLNGADLSGATGYRYPDAPDPADLRRLVAEQIRQHPELHNQSAWGDGSADPACQTPCCVAGWACHLGGGDRGDGVAPAATRLLWLDGHPMPSFDPDTTREDLLAALTA